MPDKGVRAVAPFPLPLGRGQPLPAAMIQSVRVARPSWSRSRCPRAPCVSKRCQLQLGPPSYLRYRGRVTPVVRQGNLYYLPVKSENTCVDDILVIQLQHKFEEINTIRGGVRRWALVEWFCEPDSL
eukprot:2246805-Heterocapsa_arctica.AAC.1